MPISPPAMAMCRLWVRISGEFPWLICERNRSSGTNCSATRRVSRSPNESTAIGIQPARRADSAAARTLPPIKMSRRFSISARCGCGISGVGGGSGRGQPEGQAGGQTERMRALNRRRVVASACGFVSFSATPDPPQAPRNGWIFTCGVVRGKGHVSPHRSSGINIRLNRSPK